MKLYITLLLLCLTHSLYSSIRRFVDRDPAEVSRSITASADLEALGMVEAGPYPFNPTPEQAKKPAEQPKK